MKKLITCYNYKEQIFYKGEFASFEENNISIFKLKVINFQYEGRHEMPFFALIELREKLEKNDIFILFKGCLKNVYPSGMSLYSFYAYKLYLGKQATEEIKILDPISVDEISHLSTIDDQKKFWQGWLNSLGRGKGGG